MTILVPLNKSASNDFQLGVLNNNTVWIVCQRKQFVLSLCFVNYLSIRQKLFSRIISVTTELNKIFCRSTQIMLKSVTFYPNLNKMNAKQKV